MIILGADFSLNACAKEIWYNDFTGNEPNLAVSGSVVNIDLDAIDILGLINKPINRIKLFAIAAKDNLQIGISQVTNRDEEIYERIEITNTFHSYSVVAGENIIDLVTPITLSAGECITFKFTKNILGAFNDCSTIEVVESNKGVAIGYGTSWATYRIKIPMVFGFYDNI